MANRDKVERPPVAEPHLRAIDDDPALAEARAARKERMAQAMQSPVGNKLIDAVFDHFLRLDLNLDGVREAFDRHVSSRIQVAAMAKRAEEKEADGQA